MAVERPSDFPSSLDRPSSTGSARVAARTTRGPSTTQKGGFENTVKPDYDEPGQSELRYILNKSKSVTKMHAKHIPYNEVHIGYIELGVRCLGAAIEVLIGHDSRC